MSDDLLIAGQIAIVGMGLVFASILLLWLVMSLLVHGTADRQAEETQTADSDQAVGLERKRQAAATAVAIALALETDAKPHILPTPPTPLVSAWQAVMRSSILEKRGSVR
ncbi:MAG: OadG family protein [Chloroflexi bacterium]|nr:OadG family protein [Chloroflexota bacterium]